MDYQPNARPYPDSPPRTSPDAGHHAPFNDTLNRKISRRNFMLGAGAAGLGIAFAPLMGRVGDALAATHAARQTPLHKIRLNINGTARRLTVDPRVTLLDALRDKLQLTGTKKGCDHGQCGACTLHMDGRRVDSCLVLAMAADGARIDTIEGLAQGDKLHPMQAAFVEHDGFQCGYCTSGQIMSAVALLKEGQAHTDDEIREAMAGNLCRCGAYPGIVAAIKSAREQQL